MIYFLAALILLALFKPLRELGRLFLAALLLAGLVGHWLGLAAPAAGAEPVPSAHRVYMLCAIEDPSCGPLLRESFARVESEHSPCPAGETLPDRVLFGAIAGMLPNLAALAPAQPIDWAVSSAVSTILPEYCARR